MMIEESNVFCNQCGAASPPDNKFCGGCGAPLAAAPPVVESNATGGAQPQSSNSFVQGWRNSPRPIRGTIGCVGALLGFIVLMLIIVPSPEHAPESQSAPAVATSPAKPITEAPAQSPPKEKEPEYTGDIKILEEVPAPAPAPLKDLEVARWSGRGSKKTESFTVQSDEWIIDWDTQSGGTFSIMVYTKGGDMVALAANVMGADKDKSVMHGAGTYYLDFSATQSYKVRVTEK